MTVKFNADEIFEIAEKIEINGAGFYRKAAKVFGTDRAADLLNSLASMEDEHRIIFAAMRSKVSENESGSPLFDPDGDTAKYLRAIADGKVFELHINPSALFTGKETIQEILRIAIGFEKDSIILYLGIKDMVPPSLGKDKIDRIIAEEKRHILLLSDQLVK